MKTTRHRRPGIRWGRVVLLPILVVAVAVAFMAVIYINDQKNLKSIEDRVKQLQEELQEYLDSHQNQELVQTVIASADGLALRYEYDEALAVLKQNEAIQTNAMIKERIATYQAALDALVPFTSELPVVFFHNLVNNPKLAFGSSGDYDQWSITNNEFELILQQLYDKGYILVDINDVFDLSAGNMKRKEIKIPAGKIPLLLMVDENAYQDPMPLRGYARGMGIRDGEIVTRVLKAEGVDFTNDGDVVPIVETFIKENPDFSYRGGRGVLSLTGFAGTLGYRLTNDIEVNDAKLLANLLKEKGWDFACTSYSDLESMYLQSPNAASIKSDLQKWDAKIKPIVGDTVIFVSPYGNRFTSDVMATIAEFGYTAFFYDGSTPSMTVSGGFLNLSRIAITGESIVQNNAYINEHFFDTKAVIDPERE